jgi:hypothetical protein
VLKIGKKLPSKEKKKDTDLARSFISIYDDLDMYDCRALSIMHASRSAGDSRVASPVWSPPSISNSRCNQFSTNATSWMLENSSPLKNTRAAEWIAGGWRRRCRSISGTANWRIGSQETTHACNGRRPISNRTLFLTRLSAEQLYTNKLEKT